MRRHATAARLSTGTWLLLWGALVLGGVITNGCVDKFVACDAPGARPCPLLAGGQGGTTVTPIPTAGEGGSGGETSVPMPEGGMAGAPVDPRKPCKKEGLTTCSGPAQSNYEICRGGFLEERECEAGSLCDSTDNKCKKLAEGCEERKPGERFCSGDVLHVCGDDLVTVSSIQCDGACFEGDCRNPTCGDGKPAEGEACDDGNTTPGDGCSATCQWEPIRVEAGHSTICALFKNGDLKCWGANQFGQLGIGNVDDMGDNPGEMGKDLPVAMTEVVDFAVGRQHVCAAASSGGVYCWGDNSYGQLGESPDSGHLSSFETRPVPTRLPPAKVIALTAGDWHTCALMKDQQVYCWGGNKQAQCGAGFGSDYYPQEADTPFAPAGLGGETPRAIGAGFDLTCALLDTRVRCWGANSDGQSGVSSRGEAVPIANRDVSLGTFPVSSIAVGRAHVCARAETGDVKCWGLNGNGQLGHENVASVGEDQTQMGTLLSATRIGNALSIQAGGMSTCAMLRKGEVVCWGSNDHGALGREYSVGNDNVGDDPGEMSSLVPVDVGANERIKSWSMGEKFSCALLESGRIKCWGDNSDGQLGVGDTNDRGDSAGEMGDGLEYTWVGEDDESSLPKSATK
ncbi:MAG TPA: DUF4215 domain-containing protein [Polyangiaceae bacterium]|nr:DUF4215 domain-containing protein [Polyangiaceae bacterium]